MLYAILTEQVQAFAKRFVTPIIKSEPAVGGKSGFGTQFAAHWPRPEGDS